MNIGVKLETLSNSGKIGRHIFLDINEYIESEPVFPASSVADTSTAVLPKENDDGTIDRLAELQQVP
ncbi:MAG: hypothetical protein ACI8W1_001025 [Candidatus Azotimanducaceae bacterium]